jgi:hypothetical protein
MAVSNFNIFASTVDEFSDNAAAEFGPGTLGETKPHVSVNWRLGDDGRITSATMTMTISSRTAHWAGSGISNGRHLPQPDAANRTAIDRVEALNRAHEQRHIDTYRSTFDAQRAAIERQYVGRTETEADAVTAQMAQALLDACEALHRTEGLVTVTHTGTQISVAVRPAGPGGCT